METDGYHKLRECVEEIETLAKKVEALKAGDRRPSDRHIQMTVSLLEDAAARLGYWGVKQYLKELR